MKSNDSSKYGENWRQKNVANLSEEPVCGQISSNGWVTCKLKEKKQEKKKKKKKKKKKQSQRDEQRNLILIALAKKILYGSIECSQQRKHSEEL